MIRWLQAVSICAAAGAAVFVFQVKYRGEAVAERAADLQRQVDAERERLSLLRAEWSYLVQPIRIEEMVALYGADLELQPLDPAQITTIADLPMRPPGPAPEDEAALSAILGETTGEQQ